MATFDTLIDDLASRYGLGGNARSLIREALTMIANSPGGLSGFLDGLKSAGLTSEVASWVGHADAAPIAAAQVERALGATALSGIAGRLGLAQGVVSTALGYALPKIVGLLTPGGAVPAGVPAEVTGFLSQPRAAAATEPVAPRRLDVNPASAQNKSGVRRWLWPALAALVVVGLLSYFWSTLNRMPSAPPVAKAPEPATPAPSTVAQAPSPPPAPSPAAQAPSPPPSPTEAQAPAPAPPTDAHAPAPQASPPPAAPAPSTEARGQLVVADACALDGSAGDGRPTRACSVHGSTSDSSAGFAFAGGASARRPGFASVDRTGACNPGSCRSRNG